MSISLIRLLSTLLSSPRPLRPAPLLGKLTAASGVWSAALPASVAARPQPPGAVELEVAGQQGKRGPEQKQQQQPLIPSPPPMEASLTCAVCLSLLEEPVTLPLCSHNFCRSCVLECLASAEAARLQQLQRSPGQARLGRGAPGPGPSCARVPCPLCRKLCLLPRGGVAALPVNTTLAEVVKLYRSGAAGAAAAGEAAPGPKPGSDPVSLPAFGGSCQKHPSRFVQLYCRMCRQAGCGQCVSEEHQGIFHSVNLIDTVYQEEKLTFFSTLKQMRIINEKLVNEISKRPNDADMMLKNDVEIIDTKFGEIFKTLEMKKQQLLEDVKNRRDKKEKEFQIWKKMKETHKKTIENFLKDCEKLVHECDPQCFLEVACGLNTRMKTQLDVMNIASNWENPPVSMPKKIDIKSVVNEILALELTPVDAELPYEGNESSTLFKDTLKQWQGQKNTPNTFLPVAGQDEADGRRIPTRFMSISEMSAFQNMSHEELRYKYYMDLQKLGNVFKTQNFPANKKYKFVTGEASKDKSSGTSFISSPTKANNADKIKMGALRRGGGFDKRNFSGSSAYSIPSTNVIFSETNGDSNLFHEGSDQDVSIPASSETSPDFLINKKWPRQASAGTVSYEVNSNCSTSSNLNPAAAVGVTVSNSESVDVSAERPSGVPFTFSACNNSLPKFSKDRSTFSFKKQDKRCTFPQFYLGRCDKVDKTNNQDNSDPETKNMVCDASTSPNLDSAESEKSHVLFPFSNSERDRFAGSEVSNSCKVLPSSSLFSRYEKPSDKKPSSHMREKTPCAKEPAGCGTQKPSVLGEEQPHTSESSTTIAYGTSETNAGVRANDVFKLSPYNSNCAFSFKSNFPLSSSVFSFGGIVRNTSDLLTSSMFFSGNRTEKLDKEKMKSPDNTLVDLEKPVSSECAEPASLQSHPECEGSCLPMNSSKNTESAERLGDGNTPCQPLCSGVLEYENASSTQLTTAAQQQEKVEDEETVPENNCVYPRREDKPEPVQFQNTACSVPGTSGTCNDPSLGGSVLAVREMGGMLRDSTSDT